MILKALTDYYDRLVKDKEDIALPGFSDEIISFCIIIDSKGNFVQDEDLRDHSGKKPAPRLMRVPQGGKRSIGVNANLLWDNISYVLGLPIKDKLEEAAKKSDGIEKYLERVASMFKDFKGKVDGISAATTSSQLKALSHFLNNLDTTNLPPLRYLEEMQGGANVVFRIDGETNYIHEHPDVVKTINASSETDQAVKGMCLITGDTDTELARLHPSIKGITGTQSTGASIISFTPKSFVSYGKTQSYNAPVSIAAAFAYTTVLNRMLRFESKQKTRLGDTTVLFWAEQATPAEFILPGFYTPDTKDKDGQDNTALHKELALFLESAKNGKSLPPSFGSSDIKFYILGLSPNAARISVRFWYDNTLGDIHRRVGEHLRDCDIEKQYDSDPDTPTLWRVLLESATLYKTENIPPQLEGAYVQAVMTGAPYPRTLLARIIGRIRADRNINFVRAYALKGYFKRNAKYNKTLQEVTVSLDKDNRNPAYLLGRLFAVLEKAQTDVIQANATIKDRFYGAASATPARVFPLLIRLSQHHIAKSDYGRFRDIEIQEITEHMDNFPKTLTLEEQGMFALGYYHQKNSMYKSKKENNDAAANQ